METRRFAGARRWAAVAASVALLAVLAFCVVAMIAVHRFEPERLVRCAVWPTSGAPAHFFCRLDFHLRHFEPGARSHDGELLLQRALGELAAPPRHPQTDDLRRLAVADLLLAHGVDVDATGGDGLTLLMTAVRENNLPLARFLLSRRANPRAMGTGEFSTISAVDLAKRLYEANSTQFQKLLACDRSGFEVTADGASELAKMLEYGRFRTLALAKELSGVEVGDASRCQPVPPAERERLLARASPALGGELVQLLSSPR